MAKIKCVFGAVCSGKSTYVQGNAGENDLIWDYDHVRTTLTTRDEHDTNTTDAQIEMTNKLRYTFALNARGINAENIWFICSKPTERIKELLGDDAEYIEMDVTEQECLDRLAKDDSRKDKELFERLIHEYYKNERSKPMKENMEIRAFNFEMRARADEEHGTYVEGTPIVYDSWTDLGWYDEIIDRGALDDTDLRDVRFLINHNTDMIPLARSRNNNENSSMQMSIGDEGMKIRVNLDTENNADARALYSAIERGDISGMSFMFTVDGDRWEDETSDHPKRHIEKISRVFEVSAVTFPAYEATNISARGLSDALDSARASLESVRADRRAKELQKQKIRIMSEV